MGRFSLTINLIFLPTTGLNYSDIFIILQLINQNIEKIFIGFKIY